MSIIKLTHDSYLPVSPDTTKDEYDEYMASELYLLVVSPLYKITYNSGYYYPWLLHLRQSLYHINLECFKRTKVLQP